MFEEELRGDRSPYLGECQMVGVERGRGRGEESYFAFILLTVFLGQVTG